MKTTIELSDKVKEFIKTGNADLFTGIYEESYGYLHTCAIHVMKNEDEAQDILQDAYIEIFRNLSSLKDPDSFLGWAATITNRKCFAALKKDRDILVDERVDDEGNVSDFFDNIKDDEAFIPENILDNEENCRLIREIVDGLNEVQRLCVISYFFNEKKQDEIAEEFGIPLNTVKSHLSRAKAKIKEAVEDMEKNKGTKLYALAPFMLLLFAKEAKACDVPPMPEALKRVALENTKITDGVAKKVVKDAVKVSVHRNNIIAMTAIIGTAGVIGAVTFKNRKPEQVDVEEGTYIVEEAATEVTDSYDEEVEKIESQILAIGDITLDRADEINNVYEEYSSLSDDQKANVKSGNNLVLAKEELDKLIEADNYRNGWLRDNNIVISGQGDFTYITSVSDEMHSDQTIGEINVPCHVTIVESTEGCEDGYKEISCTFTSDFSEANNNFWHITCDIVDRYTGLEIIRGEEGSSRDFNSGDARGDGYCDYNNIITFSDNTFDVKKKSEASYNYPIFQNTESILCPVDYDGAVFLIGYSAVEMQQNRDDSNKYSAHTYDISRLDSAHTYYFFTYSND